MQDSTIFRRGQVIVFFHNVDLLLADGSKVVLFPALKANVAKRWAIGFAYAMRLAAEFTINLLGEVFQFVLRSVGVRSKSMPLPLFRDFLYTVLLPFWPPSQRPVLVMFPMHWRVLQLWSRLAWARARVFHEGNEELRKLFCPG